MASDRHLQSLVRRYPPVPQPQTDAGLVGSWCHHQYRWQCLVQDGSYSWESARWHISRLLKSYGVKRDIATNTAGASGTCAHYYVPSSSLPSRGSDTEGLTDSFLQTLILIPKSASNFTPTVLNRTRKKVP